MEIGDNGSEEKEMLEEEVNEDDDEKSLESDELGESENDFVVNDSDSKVTEESETKE